MPKDMKKPHSTNINAKIAKRHSRHVCMKFDKFSFDPFLCRASTSVLWKKPSLRVATTTERPVAGTTLNRRWAFESTLYFPSQVHHFLKSSLEIWKFWGIWTALPQTFEQMALDGVL